VRRGLLAAPLVAAAALAAGGFPDHAPVAMTGGFGERTCASCHFGTDLNDPGGAFAIEGVPARYVPGAEYALRVRLARPGMGAAGFQLTARYAGGGGAGAQAGSLAAEGAAEVRAAEDVQYAGHTDGRSAAAAGEAAWTVRWRAPDGGGPVVFHAAANAADGDESPLGDHVYTVQAIARP
jgi:hypothetical protein